MSVPVSSAGVGEGHPEPVRLRAQEPYTRLSEAAKSLIVAAAFDPGGRVLRSRSSDGLLIATGGRNFVPDRDPRVEARWERALRELIELELIEPRNTKGTVFSVTSEGFEVADQLRADAGQTA